MSLLYLIGTIILLWLLYKLCLKVWWMLIVSSFIMGFCAYYLWDWNWWQAILAGVFTIRIIIYLSHKNMDFKVRIWFDEKRKKIKELKKRLTPKLLYDSNVSEMKQCFAKVLAALNTEYTADAAFLRNELRSILKIHDSQFEQSPCLLYIYSDCMLNHNYYNSWLSVMKYYGHCRAERNYKIHKDIIKEYYVRQISIYRTNLWHGAMTITLFWSKGRVRTDRDDLTRIPDYDWTKPPRLLYTSCNYYTEWGNIVSVRPIAQAQLSFSNGKLESYSVNNGTTRYLFIGDMIE